MKGFLQYCSTEEGTYAYVGAVKPFKDQVFKIDPIKVNDYDDYPESVTYRITCRALCHELASGFLNENEWYFRIYFPDDSKKIMLGQRRYHITYDPQLLRNELEYYYIDLEFNSDTLLQPEAA